MLKISLLILLLLLPNLVKADTILDQFKNLPLKEGVMYDFKHQRALHTLGFGVLGWKDLEIDVAYIGTDGIGAALNYNLQHLPFTNAPILFYTKYLNIGYVAGIRTITSVSSDDTNAKSDNEFIQGPVVFIKLNF